MDTQEDKLTTEVNTPEITTKKGRLDAKSYFLLGALFFIVLINTINAISILF
ncbi:hypothetical protein R9C00_05510 [Flammeovirgaceae bacterium SG7u.111]|nr:hypothetical protein [Flammeovirgaceae bacterium SG7u.132]WPO36898.1 hypothetical protein R9C00_05510 [Flammeovirgaceae bacterium SG7u.111]